VRNVCFICSLPREIFERQRIVFSLHTSVEHNVWSYMDYALYLSKKDETELTGMQSYLKTLMDKQVGMMGAGCHGGGASLCGTELPSLRSGRASRTSRSSAPWR
jgi:hypothetical protein